MKKDRFAQKRFINEIKNKYTNKYNLVYKIADVLDISIESAYRRINGKVNLTFDEIKCLCEYFHISFDSIIRNSSNETFEFVGSMESSITDHDTMIDKLYDFLQNIKVNGKITYFGNDIFCLHLFNFPELVEFQKFAWRFFVSKQIERKKFEFELNEERILYYKQIYKTFSRISSKEIWCTRCIDNLLVYINYFNTIGMFASNDIIVRLYEKIAEMINLLWYQSNVGRKIKNKESNPEGYGSFELYLSEIDLGCNNFFLEDGNHKTILLKLYNVNYLQCISSKVYNEYNQWIDNVFKCGVRISNENIKVSYQYFNDALSKLYMHIGLLKDKKNDKNSFTPKTLVNIQI